MKRSLLTIVTIFTIVGSIAVAVPRQNKNVGILYETWFNRYASFTSVYPNFPAINLPMWWATPSLGRYRSDSSSVINTHATQLYNAGVDFIVIDISNNNIRSSDLWSGTIALLDAYRNRTQPKPKIVFLSSYASNGTTNDLQQLYDLVYRVYPASLFFYVKSKPLLLVSGESGCATLISGLSASARFECKDTIGNDNARSDKWSFLNQSPQRYYSRYAFAEEIAVSAAQQSPYMNSSLARGRKYNYTSGLNNGYEGQNFYDQWHFAKQSHATYVIVKAWNEWVAHRFVDNNHTCGNNCYVDEFSPEYSNDIEPVSGLFGNTYLSLLTNYIFEYKRYSADLYLYDQSVGKWYMREGWGAPIEGDTNYYHDFAWPQGNNYQPIVGDFDDNNTTDIGVRDVNTGVWYFAFSQGNGNYLQSKSFSWAPGAHYQPVVGDFNDDGKTDIAMRDTSNGTWSFAFHLGNNSYANTRNFAWPSPSNFQPFSGDFNNDGKTDIGMRDPSSGIWFFAFHFGSNDNNYYNNQNFNWASGSHYQPFIADFDCDGHDDIGMRDSFGGTIYMATAANGSFNNDSEKNYRWRTGSNFQILSQPSMCKSDY